MSDFIYHKPRQILVENINNTKIINEESDIGLICPKCLHIVETHIINNRSASNITDKIKIFDMSPRYKGRCPNCNRKVYFESIDGNMVQIINILNIKGYYTVFCCEGHIENNMFSGRKIFTPPYIYFYFWEDAEVLKTHPLPDTWFISNMDIECEVFSIQDHTKKIIPKSLLENDGYVDNEKQLAWYEANWNQEKSLRDIYNWAVGLPDKSEDEKIRLFDIIKNDGKNIIDNNTKRRMNYKK